MISGNTAAGLWQGTCGQQGLTSLWGSAQFVKHLHWHHFAHISLFVIYGCFFVFLWHLSATGNSTLLSAKDCLQAPWKGQCQVHWLWGSIDIAWSMPVGWVGIFQISSSQSHEEPSRCVHKNAQYHWELKSEHQVLVGTLCCFSGSEKPWELRPLDSI